MANEVVERASGRLRLLYGRDMEIVRRAVDAANATNEPIEILNADYQHLGYIVSKEYIRRLKKAAQPCTK